MTVKKMGEKVMWKKKMKHLDYYKMQRTWTKNIKMKEGK